GPRRPALAADPDPGLLEPAASAAGTARAGLRLHAPLREAGRAHLEFRTDDRRPPRRSPPRPAAGRAARGQRVSVRPADPRARLLRWSNSPTPTLSKAYGPRSPRTRTRSTTAAPTTWSRRSAPTARSTSPAWGRTKGATRCTQRTPSGGRVARSVIS